MKKHNFIQGISPKRNFWDNAVAESFFYALKTQLINHVQFSDARTAEQRLFTYIEIYYNRRRKHSTNGYKSPADFEEENYKLKN